MVVTENPCEHLQDVGKALRKRYASISMNEYPLIFRVRQRFDAPEIDDVAGKVESQLSHLSLDGIIKTGQTVAVAVGSRGIAEPPDAKLMWIQNTSYEAGGS